MQIERIISDITTLGPGMRLCIWVNGCKRNCVGCVSPRLKEFVPDNDQDIIALLNQFDLSSIDGVTISGGEPFEQVHDLWLLVEHIRKLGIDDILIYTGYTISELLNKNDSEIYKILSNIAVLIDGPYIHELNNDENNLLGSSNQKVIYLNAQYIPIYENYCKKQRSIQEITAGNILIGVGIPTKEYVTNFYKNIPE